MKTGIFTRKSALPIIMTTFLLILVTITIASAEVTELKVEPQEVDPGEVISITGKAAQNEYVWISSSFEHSLTVSDGKYSGVFNDVHFIRGEKVFSVTVEHVKNVRASLYPVFWTTIDYPLDGPKTATGGIATLSVPFPAERSGVKVDISGKKKVEVYGDAEDGATSVNLNVDITLKSREDYTPLADSNGDFSLDINTEGVPEGEFLISAGGIEKTVSIGTPTTPSPSPSPTPTPTPSPSPTPTPSSTGGSGSAAETTPTPTPASNTTTPENVTSNETPTPTPTVILTPTPASTTTPIKTETGDKTQSTTPQNETNQFPQETTEPSGIPGFGFEAIGCIAIAALIMVIMKMVLVYR